MKYLYTPLDFFLLRTPTYPIDNFKSIIDVGSEEEILDYILNNVLSNEKIIEMLIVASPKLYEALLRLENNPDTKKKEQIILNVTKYLIRMSTRSTPFGLFSGVSMGDFEDKTDIQIDDINHFIKTARPDMAWLLGCIKQIESDINNVKCLKVMVNHLTVTSGLRANLLYSTQYGERSKATKKEVVSSSIKYNEVTQKVFDRAQEPILFSTLIDSIKSEYPNVQEETITQFVWNLFENEYLISELRPILTNGNPFEYVINKLSEKEALTKYYVQLTKLKEDIDIYNGLSLGEGKELLLNLFDKMREIYEVDTPLQVDLSIKTKHSTISKSIQNELAKVADFLWVLTPKENINNELDHYRNDFLEKYGEYREISILELLNPDIGLGAPGGYLNPPSYKKVENPPVNQLNEFENYLLEEISRLSCSNNEDIREINIENKIYEKFKKKDMDLNKAAVSMELYFRIISESFSNIDNEEYQIQLVPNAGSDGAGKTFGRFNQLFNEENQEKLYKINQLEKSFYEDTIFAEMVYLPDYGRSANVTISNSIRDYELCIGTNSSKDKKHTLSMSDLVVGVYQGNFYIRSKSLNKRVIITTGHMLNIAGCHNLCRLLKELSNHGMVHWKLPIFSWMTKMAFVPRINLGKVTIIPAMWNLNLNMLDINVKELKKDFELFKKQFHKWCEEYNVPRYIYLFDMDNRILIDTKNNLHVKIIQKEMSSSKGNKVQFYEMGNEICKEWIEGDTGTYISEVVVPFVKNSEVVEEKMKVHFNASHSIECDQVRTKALGSDWLYFRIYCNNNMEDEFIGRELQLICNNAVSEGLADKYFFMRYSDNKKHIRLRFNMLNKDNFPKLISYINTHCNQLKAKGIVSNVAIDVYEREVERYGGPELIGEAEDLFYLDSQFVQELIRLKENNLLNTSFENICIYSILDYLQGFGLTHEEQLKLMEAVVDYKEYLEDFRKGKKVLVNLCNKNNVIDFGITTDNSNLYELLAARKKQIKLYKEKIDDIEIQGKLFNVRENIILSVIHLHCNRLIGIDRVYEKKLNTLARHTLKALSYFYEQQNKILITH
ncbi:lantibiotic dehydratase [Bacillus cereus]|uniref:lantibiotic dehydratase n=1 Tax=Bacillus cereus TaxID=1396 RepID=UPI000B4A8027|nr:lantibiotic dehydratase [Bacillus cereus]